MIEDKPIDLKMENRRLGIELSSLRQKNEELKEDRDYIKLLLDVEFEKRIKLSKENEQLKQDKKRLIGYLHRYGKVDVEDIDDVILNKEYLDKWGDLYD